MFHCYRKSAFYLKGFLQTSQISWLRVLLPQHYTTTITNKRHCFRMNYLVKNYGFSPEIASYLSKHASFLNSENPDSILNLLRNLNVPDSEIRDAVKRFPGLLSITDVSPKLGFFKSKGASNSQLAHIVFSNPWILHKNLENHITPMYDLLRSFLHSDETTILVIRRLPKIMTDHYLAQKIKLLQDYGVTESGIALILKSWTCMLSFLLGELKNKADEVKGLGFHPSKTSFLEALKTKISLSTSSWERRTELYRRWGWSDETLLKAFLKRPFCMMTSDSKIEAVMEFLVNQMGWHPLKVAEYPIVVSLSLEKRIIPRASVLQFLQSRGLIEKSANINPFLLTENMFHKKFVSCFKHEVPQLLKLYEEKLKLST